MRVVLKSKFVFVAAMFGSLATSHTDASTAGKTVVQQVDEPVTSASAVVNIDFEKLFSDKAYAAELLQHIEALERVAAEKDVLHPLLTIKAINYVALNKGREAIALSERLRRDRPHEAISYFGSWNGYLGDARVDDAILMLEQAASTVTDLGEQAHLHDLLHQEGVDYLFSAVSADADKARRIRMAEALVLLGWPGSRDPETRDYLRLIAAKAKRRRGESAQAAAVAATIESPRPLVELMIDRRFDDVFGPSADRSKLVRAALAREDKLSLEAVSEDPDNLVATLRRVQFLRSVGRDAEVLPLVRRLTTDMDEVERSGSKAFWILNEAAYSLASLGRGREAVELMDRLLKIDIENNPDLINMSINKGAILNQVGMHDEALRHVSAIESSQAKYASPFGMMWVAATAACALAAQDKGDEARKTLGRFKDKSGDNEAAATQAMLCLDDLDAAEQLLLKRLSGDNGVSVLMKLQKYEISGKASAIDHLTAARLEMLLQRPKVKAAIEEVGRIMSIPAARTYWGAY